MTQQLHFALSLLALVGTAAWAYHVNYRTAEALERNAALEREIAAERERIHVLSVEWARLNAPDRLRRLVEMHNAALALMPMLPDHFGRTAAVPYPPPPEPVPGPAPEAEGEEREVPPDLVAGAGAGTGDPAPAPRRPAPVRPVPSVAAAWGRP